MNPYAVIATIAAYFAVAVLVSRLSQRGGGDFFGGRRNSWWLVTLAMISSCMSGVTFVSVPGMVASSGMGYLQMCIGFFLGYLVIAFVLTPLYFRLGVVSIYQYLEQRFGLCSYKTGAWFFFISKLLGASVRLFLVCLTLQMLLFGPLGLPFALNVAVSVGIVLAYTWKGGVRSVIGNDILRTVCMLAAVILTTVFIARALPQGVFRTIADSGMDKFFFFDDVDHPQYFWKQVLGGLFMVVAMTGLDQDMMQRTLTCRNVRESQKNLIISSLLQTVVIAAFLCLGVLMYAYAGISGIEAKGDGLFPAVATGEGLPAVAGILFIVGLVSSAYGAGGSALTALTTSFTVDILGTKEPRTRKAVHLGMAVLMWGVIVVFAALNSTSAIDAVYSLASYTYGPILGMFAFGILTPWKVRDRLVPVAAVAAPLICLALNHYSSQLFGGYNFSYEILPINAALTFLLLCGLKRR